jgi:hypothetical protein
MKFVLHWEPRHGASAQDNLESIRGLLTVFQNWEGFKTVQTSEWVTSVADTSVGWLVCTADDTEELAAEIAKFTPFLTFALTPVQDVQRGAELAGESAGWIAQQLG